jgi:glycine/D-amino acid oxidase-like deaminating enzyme
MGQPIWLARGAPDRTLTYPRFTGRLRVDVAVVGGGLTGAAVALRFAAAGVRVALLEADRVGRGSTAASTALLLNEPDISLTALGRRYGMANARTIWQLCRHSSRETARTLRTRHVECDLIDQDSVYYTTHPEETRRLYAEYQRRCKAGLTSAWLNAAALRRLTGISGAGAIRTPDNSQLDPYRACLGLMREAAFAGAAIFERSPVQRIDSERGRVRVVSPRGVVEADRAVIATGYATPEFKPLLGRFRLNHTYVLATRPLTRSQRRALGLRDVMLWDTERPYHYLRWTPDRRLVLGGGDRPLVPARKRLQAFRAGTAALRDYFTRIFPPLSDVEIEFAWEGLFAMTSDGLPYIGPHRRYPGHLFALGYGGNGMTFGFLAARILLEQFQGVTVADHDLFAFGRHR